MKKLLVVLLFLAACGGGTWWYLNGKNTDTLKVIKSQPLARGTVREVLEATGIVKAQVGAEVDIGTQATGVIRAMHVREGDAVRAGQLVAVIDDREQMTRRREAAAALAKARAELDSVTKVAPLKIAEATANLEEAQAREQYARKTLVRKKQLAAAKQTSQDDLDAAAQDADVAERSVIAARATLDRIRAEADLDRTRALRGVEQAEATLESVDIDISHTRIHSPMDGIVSQVAAQEGETVVTGLQVASLITVLDPTRLEMWIYVDETDIGRVQPGMPVEFQVDAYPDAVFDGEVKTIYPAPESMDNIVYYRALVGVTRDQADRLRPEMTTQCRIVVERRDNVLALPNEALKWVDGKQVVFSGKSADAPFAPVTPKLGLAGLQTTEVLGGLAEGDLVATRVVLPGKGGGSGSGSGGGKGGGPGRR